MPILSTVGKQSWSQRFAVLTIYLTLSVLGLTMVVPFLITLTSSISNEMDYQRFQPIPRYFYSKEDRFTKGLVNFFNQYKDWRKQFQAYFTDVPDNWTMWIAIGKNTKQVDRFAVQYLDATPEQIEAWKVMASDYSDFAQNYPIDDCLVPIDRVRVASTVGEKFAKVWVAENPSERKKASIKERREGSIDKIYESWGIHFPDLSQISFNSELDAPYWQQNWYPPESNKYETFRDLKRDYRSHVYTPGVLGAWMNFLKAQNFAYTDSEEVWPVLEKSPAQVKRLWNEFVKVDAPASPAVPFALRVVWWDYLQSEKVESEIKQQMDIGVYNKLAGTTYKSFRDIPFPVPADHGAGIQKLWKDFLDTRYPMRLVKIQVTPDFSRQYQALVKDRLKTIENANKILGTSYTKWEEFPLSTVAPGGKDYMQQKIWGDFVRSLPENAKTYHSSESSFQQAMLNKYGSLAGLNKAWNTSYTHIEEVFPPLDKAYYFTFKNHELAMTLAPMGFNYQIIADYLLHRGRALPVTLILITGAILVTLTVNPIAAYALSRFNMRGQDKIILFLLATSAFPAMISAIPGYLLMRDLGLLNTFFALLLPGAANGMSIFILKGFFDSLPPELFEAATIDGAKEWQIFLFVTMPMIKPILAVNALNAFIHAYNGWEWALIICQDKDMWTLAVWMYQASQWWKATPWIATAGFVITSIPTLVVFLTCQKIILRGIIIPQMK